MEPIWVLLCFLILGIFALLWWLMRRERVRDFSDANSADKTLIDYVRPTTSKEIQPTASSPELTQVLTEDKATHAWLILVVPRASVPFKFELGKATRIGRDVTRNDIVMDHMLEDLTISRDHALIRFENGRYVLHDYSQYGTSVNGRSMWETKRKCTLMDGDEIKIGSTTLIFKEIRL